jgi:hypothetical protein
LRSEYEGRRHLVCRRKDPAAMAGANTNEQRQANHQLIDRRSGCMHALLPVFFMRTYRNRLDSNQIQRCPVLNNILILNLNNLCCFFLP